MNGWVGHCGACAGEGGWGGGSLSRCLLYLRRAPTHMRQTLAGSDPLDLSTFLGLLPHPLIRHRPSCHPIKGTHRRASCAGPPSACEPCAAPILRPNRRPDLPAPSVWGLMQHGLRGRPRITPTPLPLKRRVHPNKVEPRPGQLNNGIRSPEKNHVPPSNPPPPQLSNQCGHPELPLDTLTQPLWRPPPPPPTHRIHGSVA